MNIGVKFEKQTEDKKWVGVLDTDNACPVSNLAQCIFKDIGRNQKKCTNKEIALFT